MHISPISTNSHEGNKVFRIYRCAAGDGEASTYEEEEMARPAPRNRAALSLFCGNFSHSDPLRTITKWLAENVRNIIGGALLVAVFVAEARPWNEISRSAKNQCWFGGKFRGNVVLRRPNLANERSLPKRD